MKALWTWLQSGVNKTKKTEMKIVFFPNHYKQNKQKNESFFVFFKSLSANKLFFTSYYSLSHIRFPTMLKTEAVLTVWSCTNRRTVSNANNEPVMFLTLVNNNVLHSPPPLHLTTVLQPLSSMNSNTFSMHAIVTLTTENSQSWWKKTFHLTPICCEIIWSFWWAKE